MTYEPEKDETWNFRTLLSQGVIFDISYQLTSPTLFLPFLYMALGAPVLFAGLILPIVEVSYLVSQVVAAPLLRRPLLRKWYLSLSFIAMAAGLCVIAIASYNAEAVLLALLFLLAAAILGVSQGTSTITIQDLVGRVLPYHRRNSLFFTQAALAAALTIFIAYGSQHFGTHDSPVAEHLELLWAGIALTLFAAVVVLLIRETPPLRAAPAEEKTADRAGAPHGRIKDYFTRLAAALRIAWFRRYLVVRTLFLSVEMAMPFYALHAASHHANHGGSLSIFVIGSSAGIILGGMLWQRVARLSPVAAMGGSALVACAGGSLSLATAYLPELRTVMLHGGVFLLIAMANEGARNARKLYVIEHTSDEDRPYYIALSNVFAGVVGTVVSFGLGALAHLQHVVWPIWLLVGLNVVAFIYARRLSENPAPVPAERALAYGNPATPWKH